MLCRMRSAVRHAIDSGLVPTPFVPPMSLTDANGAISRHASGRCIAPRGHGGHRQDEQHARRASSGVVVSCRRFYLSASSCDTFVNLTRERRYNAGRIYTFTGDIVISLNPYKALPGLYDIPALVGGDAHPSSAVAVAASGGLTGHASVDARTPHVFTVAERAYRRMLEEANPSRRNQSMIVSGESGAGKTEACK